MRVECGGGNGKFESRGGERERRMNRAYPAPTGLAGSGEGEVPDSFEYGAWVTGSWDREQALPSLPFKR